MFINNDELKKMLVAQEELNVKFTENWRKDVKHEEIFTAIFTEVAEFLESSPEEWKWWKRNYLKNDTQNQYIEIVDVIHFGLSYILYNNSVEDIINQNETAGIVNLELFNALEQFRLYNTIQNFYGLISSMTKYAGLDESELIRIYFEKLAINHKRVDGGYTEGTYAKLDSDGNEDNRVIKV